MRFFKRKKEENKVNVAEIRKQKTTFPYNCQICDETSNEYFVKELRKHYQLSHTKAEMINFLMLVSESMAKNGEYA